MNEHQEILKDIVQLKILMSFMYCIVAQSVFQP